MPTASTAYWVAATRSPAVILCLASSTPATATTMTWSTGAMAVACAVARACTRQVA